MAWADSATTMLRVVINDWTEPYTYTDDDLLQILVVAAQYVKQDIVLSTNYTIDVIAKTITPDPTELPYSAIDGDAFLNLLVLKAACLMDQGDARIAAAQNGIKAIAGPVALDIKGDHIRGFETLLKMGSCKLYEEMKNQWNFGDSMANLARFILGPYGDDSGPLWYVQQQYGTFYHKLS